MKKFIYILCIVGFTIPGLTQKLAKYEEVLPSILTLPPSGALAQLKIYLAEEPENSSIYLQMAVIYEDRYRNSDVIKDFPYKYGNAREALAAYQRTEQFISDKDVKRNEENYFNFGKYDEKGKLDVSYDSIRNKIATVKTELQQFIDNAPLIYEKFTKSYSAYDKAHKLFTEILGEYPTFKDLYLLFDEDVDQKFETIKQEYLSSLKYWKEYETALANYDIGYHQKQTVYPIKTYRLDGMESKINFLLDDIHIWNYAEWVDTTRAVIDTEIAALRASLAEENLRLNQGVERAPDDFSSETFEPLKVSKEILFNLRKYDLNSVIEPIFLFKEKKHELIYQQLVSQTLDTNTTVAVDRKLYLYGQMVNRIREADSVLSDIRNRNTKASMDKYASFITSYYQDQDGINQFVSAEKSANKEAVATYVGQIQEGLYGLLGGDTLMETTRYGKTAVPLRISLPVENELLTKDRITTHRIENFDGSLFIAGIMRNEKEGKTQAYVAGVKPDKKVGWYKDYLLQLDSSAGFDSHTRIGAMHSVPGGLALILNGIDSGGVSHNHMMILDETGEITLSRRLLFDQFPRKMAYDDRTNTLLVAYKGTDFYEDIIRDSEMIMANYNILGDLLWQQRLTFKGDVAGIINAGQEHLVVGNYNEIKGLDGRISRAGKNNTDAKIYGIKISQEGEILDMLTIDHSSSFYTSMAYKVSDDCINLLGTAGPYQNSARLDTDPGTAVHIILNKDLEVLANSLN